jgi:eukaryotic-like serine/threonine-protein kinase
MSDTDHPVFNDRYEVHSRIGRGGMADVFLARDRLLDRPVAVKVLFPEYATDPSFVERFRREAQSAANLTHPNIVGVYDWGRQGSTYFIVMEYVNGRSLADILRADGVILPQRAADIAFDVAGALGFAHASNVVHRDVKPGNILVNPAGAVKVADFGIARALNSAHEQDLTQAGAVMGTATYFSPEQAQGATPDPRSDLYSLGIVMYEMVCGKPPFTGDNPVAIAYKQVHEMPRRLRDAAPEVPADYEAIVMKLLSKSPANRYADGDELRADLKRFRDGLPVSAAPRPPAPVAPIAPTTINAPVTPARGTEIVRPAAATTVQQRQPVPSQPARVSNDPMIAQQQRPAARPAPTGPAYDDEPKRTGWYIAAGVLVLALAGLLTWFLTNSNKTAKAPGEVQVTIPTDLINQPREVVEQKLRDLKLNPKPEGRVSDQAVLGNVFLLDPPGGTSVSILSDVKVIFSAAPNKKTVSNFVGGTDAAAKANLTALGLPFEIKGVESADKPAGTVIAQEPPPGDYPPGQKVILTVSNGVTQVPLPNITGLGRDAAISQLTALGLKPSSELAASDTVEKDKVIGYKPDQVPTVPKDSPIVILVSSGIGDQVVPGLAGLTQDEAFAKIQEAGFLVGNPASKDVLLGGPEDGKVVGQDPPANAKAAKKSKVTVTIGRGVAPATTTTLAPTTIATTTTIAATTTVAPAPSFGVAVTVKKTGTADSTYGETATAGATASYTWRIVVSNTGNTTLTGFSITSTVPACIFTPDQFDVAAGASKTFECTTGGISTVGALTNTATVKPTASSGGAVPGPKSDGATANTTAP